MKDLFALWPGYLTDHLQLTLVALCLGSAVSFPLGIWVSRRRRWQGGVLALAGLIQTIPSLALLAVMVPILAAAGGLTLWAFGLELHSIGFLPAIIALTLYSLLPMLQNTVAGLNGIDPAIREAAQGVGMTERQQLWQVEIPLALPVIVAGLRTSTVWVVGIATLSTPVGAPSLGNYIFSGLQTRNFKSVLVGCLSAAGLAIVLDGLVRSMELGIRHRKRARALGAGAVLGLLIAYAWISLGAEWMSRRERPIFIGTKTFTEQYILGEVLAATIQRGTGAGTRIVPSLGSTVAFDALRSGELDLYVDYSGTIWATVMKRSDIPQSADLVLQEVTDYLQVEHEILMAGSLGFENTYALAMRAAHAKELGIGTISGLAGQAATMEMAGDYEFFGRPEWASLVDKYHLSFRERRSMDSSLMYQAVAQSQVDVISAFSTDGRIGAFDLEVLTDDLRAIPPYHAIILVSGELARRRPDVIESLRGLAGTISDVSMRQMNAAVDQEGKSPQEVARKFLERLRKGTENSSPAEQVRDSQGAPNP